jgi:hypothetical protein
MHGATLKKKKHIIYSKTHFGSKASSNANGVILHIPEKVKCTFKAK